MTGAERITRTLDGRPGIMLHAFMAPAEPGITMRQYREGPALICTVRDHAKRP